MQLVRQLHGVMKCWPLGTVCWHAATGERLVVNAYKVHNTGVWLQVAGRVGDSCVDDFEVTRTRPPADEDGETWKQEA